MGKYLITVAATIVVTVIILRMLKKRVDQNPNASKKDMMKLLQTKEFQKMLNTPEGKALLKTKEFKKFAEDTAIEQVAQLIN